LSKEQPRFIKYFRDDLKNAHTVKIVNIVVALDERGKVVHSHMEHPSPLTRPMIMDILGSLREQVILDYKALEKTATCLEKAEEILNVISAPAHDSKPSIGSEPLRISKPGHSSEPS
jgi:hypothetical protein